MRDGETGGFGAINYGNEPREYGWCSTCPWQWGGEKALEGHSERRLTGLGDYLEVRMREREQA